MSRQRGNQDFDWRAVVPRELLEHVRHFLTTLRHDLRDSMNGFTVRASDDVQALARRFERLTHELERQWRISSALTELLARHTRNEPEE